MIAHCSRLALGLSVVMLGLGCRAEVAPTWAAEQATGREVEFGVSPFIPEAARVSLLRDSGAQWIRVPVNWEWLEPQPGRRRFPEMIARVKAVRRQIPGIRILVTLRAVNSWATAGQRSAQSARATVPPSDLRAYGDFVADMVKNLKGYVSAWQFENEVDGALFWGGRVEQYVSLLKAAYHSAKQADPDCIVLAAGFSGPASYALMRSDEGVALADIARERRVKHDPATRQAMFDNARRMVEAVLSEGREYFDVVDLHLYESVENTATRVQWVRKRMLDLGYDKPIWATEIAGPDPLSPGRGEAKHAREVPQRLALALAGGADVVFWLSLVDLPTAGAFRESGLATQGGRRRPAFKAYQTTVRSLAGTTFDRFVDVDPEATVLAFQRNGRPVYVTWSKRPIDVRLAVAGNSARRSDISGATREVAATGGEVVLRVDHTPVFVE